MGWIHVICILGFFFGLKLLSSVGTARLGNAISAGSMLLAIAATLAESGAVASWPFLAVGTVIGAIGAIFLRITAAPQFVALLNGLGGLASMIVAAVTLVHIETVGWQFYQSAHGIAGTAAVHCLISLSTALAIVVGGITFSGSAIACGKLSGWVPSRPLAVRISRRGSGPLLLAIAGICCVLEPRTAPWLVCLSLALGLTLVLPIGGRDMPVVISLLNSLSGVAAAMAGYLLANVPIIATGCLVGASGTLLTFSMCRAMNRSLTSVLFGAAADRAGSACAGGEVKAISSADGRWILEAARRVCIVPGYGMALAQAQHAAKNLADALRSVGADVFFVLHPVAGRMPGHMSVLLAEADVPYELLVELDDANRQMDQVDVALVIGANDTVNPAAAEDSTSPLYGMPVVEVWRAGTVLVLKRGGGSGFSGLDNPLFFRGNARMLLGDAKKTLQDLLAALAEV
ncbi:MAG: NAD(P)(+) transhydrogenase (Re/Si-specific) subunit beta [Puniceicoccales bacterium]|jgi:NAD(P) transhydrogenase subunit beta|nr:NAD(P)(+) transhydrogenase (Re/Si-specific) subunit beta [Puniceicoccales bacterium]